VVKSTVSRTTNATALDHSGRHSISIDKKEAIKVMNASFQSPGAPKYN
jgi:hypothetical protein